MTGRSKSRPNDHPPKQRSADAAKMAQVHVTGPASQIPPRNKDQSADAAKNDYLIFLQSLFGGVQGQCPEGSCT